MSSEGDEHVHQWEEATVFHEPSKLCADCGEWVNISKREFKDLFGRAHWRFQKEYEDRYKIGGYKGKRRLP